MIPFFHTTLLIQFVMNESDLFDQAQFLPVTSIRSDKNMISFQTGLTG